MIEKNHIKSPLDNQHTYAQIQLTKKGLSELKDYEKNNKIHPDTQKELLKQIIEEVGYDVPIIIDKYDVIVAGHCRAEVLKLLGYEYIDVIIKDQLSEKQIRKYRLLDNKIAELAEDNIENIKFELEALEDIQLNELYDLTLEDNFDDDFNLPDGEKGEIETVTFTLHKDQNEQLQLAINLAKSMGEYGETGNKNASGNALGRIVELFITQNSQGVQKI